MTTTASPVHVKRWALRFAFGSGGMHQHMTLHALSDPLPSLSRPEDSFERSGGCEKMFLQVTNWRLHGCSAYVKCLGGYL